MEHLFSILTNNVLLSSFGPIAIIALLCAFAFYRLYSIERQRNMEMVNKFIELSVGVKLTLDKILERFNNDKRTED